MQDQTADDQNSRSKAVRLFLTLEHSCGYYSERIVQNLVIDPAANGKKRIYDQAIQQGFRRAGETIFRPKCPSCQACIATRIRLADFQYSRAQKRCLQRNADLICEVREASDCPESFALYQKYLRHRHAGAGMDDADSDAFQSFLLSRWAHSKFVQLRKDAQLLACAVTDVTADGLSAMYTFFDPELPARSLGVAAILAQIQIARSLELPFLYLGYWIDGHPKMHYKSSYSALELFEHGVWRAAQARVSA
jgi:leucyl-tRNA---protein transferase